MLHEAGSESWRSWIPAIIAVLSSSLVVALTAHLPVALLADAAYDDAWFWMRAESIAAGHWLGEYNHLTLIKGSGYPLFLALNHALGLPLMVSQALLYTGSCLLLGTAVRRMGVSPWLVLALVVALQWHPAALAWPRVLRDNIGAAQVLLALACLLHFLYAGSEGRRGWGWAAAGGLVLGWIWSTREDSLWLVPGIALLVFARLAQAWPVRGERRRLGVGISLAAAIFAAWLSLVAGVNLAKYGVFTTIETRGSAFSEAMAALQRVRAGDPVPHVPVPRRVRESIYSVSPAFARLQPRLESADAPWQGSGCIVYPHSCGDYAGGWFMWAFRDAVADAGGHRSAVEAEAWYRSIADQVDAACGDGRLDCVTPLVGIVPPIAATQWKDLPGHVGTALSLLLWQGVGEGQTESSVGSVRAFPMWEFVGRPRVPDPAETLGARAVGWFHDTRPGWLQLRCDAPAVVLPIERMPSPDIARTFNDPAAERNRFAVPLPEIDGCTIESTTGAGSLALSAVSPETRHFRLGSGQLHFDSVHAGIPRSAEALMSVRWIRHWTGMAYEAVLPWLSLAAGLAFCWASVQAARRRRLEPLYLLAATAWCLAGGRAALLVLVQLSSFPAIEVHYMQPAFPLLLLAALASLAAVATRQQQNRPCPP